MFRQSYISTLLWTGLLGGWLALMLFVWLYPWSPPKPQSKLPGYVVFRLKPKTSEVVVNGKKIETSEGGITLPNGKHTFRVSAKGYHSARVTLSVSGDDAEILRVRLKPIAVTVTIKSYPSQAYLYQSDKPIGKTPFQGPIVPGWYTFRVSKAGFVSMQRDVQIKPNRKVQRLSIRLGGAYRRNAKNKAWIHWIPPSRLRQGTNRTDFRLTQKVCKATRKSKCPPSWFSPELPSRYHKLEGFWMDRYEVSYKRYMECVRVNRCTRPRYKTNAKQPVTGVNWKQAESFCRWAGGRLPTETEWEFAARGPKGNLFPWGFQWNPKLSNHGRFHPTKKRSQADKSDGFLHTAEVTAFVKGRSPYGIHQMAGNVAEWVADCYNPSYYRASPVKAPFYQRTPCNTRLVRGGSWLSPAWEIRSTTRQPAPPNMQSPTIGFRCVYHAKPTQPGEKP